MKRQYRDLSDVTVTFTDGEVKTYRITAGTGIGGYYLAREAGAHGVLSLFNRDQSVGIPLASIRDCQNLNHPKEGPIMTQLPNKLSDLIELALNDLEAVEAQPDKYRVNMLNWHEPQEDGICEVCFAGAVLANTIKLDPATDDWDVMESGQCATALMFALDDARRGDIRDALEQLGTEVDGQFDRGVTPYRLDPAKFKAEMRKLASDLREEQL
jgi:hypothetical protein